MTEREEFEEWHNRRFKVSDLMQAHEWSAWQAARASRWRSMDSAPLECIVSDGDDMAHAFKLWGNWKRENGSRIYSPLAWHPLPDPPTKEELENLK